jgi:hypothetical protein
MLAEFRPTEPTALGSLNVACTVESVGDKHKITLNVQSGKNLVAMDKRGTSDPFVVVTIYGGTMSDTKRGETKVQRKTLNPTWNEVLHFEIEATTLDRCSLTLFFTHLIFPRSLCCPLPFFIYISTLLVWLETFSKGAGNPHKLFFVCAVCVLLGQPIPPN